jgi:glutamyl-tRNA synthetase
MTKVRFAPSPTGYLHIGNARTALINALFARKNGGRFLLRLDDTDTERSRPEYAAAIEEDLVWLGIHWDETFRQSDRTARYAAVLDDFKARGLVYPAYETADELDRKRKRLQARHLPPIYDRAALKLTIEEKTQFEAEGRKPHWRFKLSRNTVTWPDLVRGSQSIETASLSDPVLVREDGAVLYTFASVIDDADSDITHVIRGEDHVANTAVQIELFEAIGVKPPSFGHHNLIVSVTGEEMSKRKGSLSIRSFREAGAEAMAVACVAVLTGTSEATRLLPDFDALAEAFALEKISRAQTKFDPAEIMALSAKALHEASYQSMESRLAALGAADEALWLAVRANLTKLDDVLFWRDVASADVKAIGGEADYLKQALAMLPSVLDDQSWSNWTNALKDSTGRKGKGLFMPLRLALTGLEHGPDMKAFLPLIGGRRARQRLEAAISG